MGSTSYDETRDAAETTWGGASWYGTTSGEYWTINPREYADPRKHGPEYQSRARRATTTDGWEAPLDEAAETFAAAPPDPPSPGLGADAPRNSPNASDRARRARAEAGRRDRVWTAPPEPSPRDSGVDVGDTAATPDRRVPRIDALLAADLDPIRRLGFALIAWAPLGVASASAIGEATGCASYSAACGGTGPLLPWLAQAVILGILLLTPAVSRILAAGTVAILVALVPLTGVLVAFGGASQRESSGVLALLLAISWIVGVALAVRLARGRATDAGPDAGALR
jgi:hypothetical protein